MHHLAQLAKTGVRVRPQICRGREKCTLTPLIGLVI
jgi:hypothetical protein